MDEEKFHITLKKSSCKSQQNETKTQNLVYITASHHLFFQICSPYKIVIIKQTVN